MKIWIVLIFLIYLSACTSEKADDKKSDSGSDEVRPQAETKSCFEGKIQTLLDDARTAIISPINDPEKWYFWDIRTNRIKKSVRRLFNVDSINRRGDFVIRDFGKVRYQFQKLDDGVSGYREILFFPQGSGPNLEFSRDGRYVSVFYKKGALNPNRSFIYDLRNRDMLWSSQFSDIRDMATKDDEFAAVVTFHNNRYALHTFDLLRNRIIYQRGIPDRFDSIHLTESSILIQAEDKLVGYDQNQEQSIFALAGYKMITVDSKLDFALVQGPFGAYKVIDTTSGEVEINLGLRSSLSECTMAMETFSLYCVDQKQLSSIRRFNLETATEESYCLQSI